MMGILSKKDKGVAGLNVLLAVVVFLFVLGLLVSIFSIMGGELEEQNYERTTVTVTNTISAKVINETCALADSITEGINRRACTLSITNVSNATGGEIIAAGNYTTSNCKLCLANGADAGYNNTQWNFTGTYSYSANTTASNVVFDTTDELNGVTDWFGIIIIITVMVVLILLTVIIIGAIRGSGLLSAEGTA